MAEATITISDTDEGGLTVHIDFNPPVNEDSPNTAALYTALKIMEFAQELHEEEDE